MEKTKKKKILFVTNTLETFGGGEKWLLETQLRLRKRFDVRIINPHTSIDVARAKIGELYKIYKLRGIVENIKCAGMHGKAFGSEPFILCIPGAGALRKLYREIKDSDTVYIVSFNPILLFETAFIARMMGKRTVLGLHNPNLHYIFSDKTGALARGFYKLAFGLIGNFHAINEDDGRMIKRVSDRFNIYVIPNFVDDTVRKLGVNGKEFIVLFVGRLQMHQKGIDLLGDIIVKVLSANKSVIFHIIGSDGDGTDMVKGLASTHSRNVKLLGFLDKAKLGNQYREGSLQVLPSRYESMGLVVIEAQSYGLPCVCFDVKGPKDVVKNGFSGTIIKKFDTNAFAAAILWYYNKWKTDRSGFKRAKRAIMEATLTRFSAKKRVAEIEKMLIPGKI